jgi:hypothetical protein
MAGGVGRHGALGEIEEEDPEDVNATLAVVRRSIMGGLFSCSTTLVVCSCGGE